MTENEAKPMPSEAIESSGGVPVNERMLRSIVYGSIATPIKKPESDHTHKWTIYVRGFHNEDLSTYVKRVIIKLHESFQNPTRSLEQPPYEVTETGWGEFVVNIKIVFQDPHQRPLSFMHQLKLYPSNEEAVSQLKTSRPVISEHYEEIIFDPPTEMMTKILRQEPQYFNLKTSPRYSEFEQMEREELQKIEATIAKVQSQLAEVEQKVAHMTAGATNMTSIVAADLNKKTRSRR